MSEQKHDFFDQFQSLIKSRPPKIFDFIASTSTAPWTLFLFCKVMFYMDHKGCGKATKGVEFVAKWLNLCLSTVLLEHHVESKFDAEKYLQLF